MRVLSRRSIPLFDEQQLEWVQGDVRDFHLATQACQGVEVVFHVAALPGIWGSWADYYSVNTLGTEVLLAACRAQSVKAFVYTSSASVVFDDSDHCDADETLPYAGRFLCHYPHTKALAERAVLRANGRDGLATAALRPHLIWGPGDKHLIPRLIQRSRAGKLWRVGDGANLVSTSYIVDTALAHVLAAENLLTTQTAAGRAYFVTDAKPVHLWQWIDDILARAGLTKPQRVLSPRVAWRLGHFYELLYKLFRLKSEPPLTRFLAQQLSRTHTYSSRRAAEDFGYQPRATYEEGMRQLEPEIRQLSKPTASVACTETPNVRA